MLRGGGQGQVRGVSSEETPREEEAGSKDARGMLAAAAALPVSALTSFGKRYALYLEQKPILTKSVTAGFIFALSDILAQALEKSPSDDGNNKPQRTIDWTRMLTSAAIGLFYFGPAAHYWYAMIFRILPGNSITSTLQKAALGQILFGPAFSCIFFAAGLMQSGTFSFRNWINKIRQDLPSVWLAGAGFWVSVDLISYSLLTQQWIPLFVNICSLVWTTYLVIKSYS